MSPLFLNEQKLNDSPLLDTMHSVLKWMKQNGKDSRRGAAGFHVGSVEAFSVYRLRKMWDKINHLAVPTMAALSGVEEETGDLHAQNSNQMIVVWMLYSIGRFYHR